MGRATTVDFRMTNFDHTITPGMAEALRAAPVKAVGEHTGWNFYGYVWFEDGKFREEVWVYGTPQETVDAETLEQLMQEVNNRYGAE